MCRPRKGSTLRSRPPRRILPVRIDRTRLARSHLPRNLSRSSNNLSSQSRRRRSPSRIRCRLCFRSGRRRYPIRMGGTQFAPLGLSRSRSDSSDSRCFLRSICASRPRTEGTPPRRESTSRAHNRPLDSTRPLTLRQRGRPRPTDSFGTGSRRSYPSTAPRRTRRTRGSRRRCRLCCTNCGTTRASTGRR